MRENLAQEVFAVLRQGLIYRDQLAQGIPLDIDGVQVDLKARLTLAADRADGEYLGARFALACWLDDLFIIGSPWQGEWSQRALEWSLYRTKERASLFWQQAEMAARRSDADTLEVYYLCTLLGFRGEYRGRPPELGDWREKFERGFGLKRSSSWPDMPPRTQEPEANVWALRAKDRLRWLLLGLAIVIGGLIVPVVTMAVVKLLGAA